MSALKPRLQASAWHLLVSLTVAMLAALLVFGWWYPAPFNELSGGRSLFALVVAIDVVLGPLITLVIFNTTKTRRHLAMDFTVIGCLQIAAMSYGLWTVFIARPVHLVFEYQRMAVVHAVDIPPSLLAQAPKNLQNLPLRGPTLLSLRPLQAHEAVESVLLATDGIAQAAQAHLWQPYDDARAQILKTASPLAQLTARYPQHLEVIAHAVEKTNRPAGSLLTLPLLSRSMAWTILLDAESAQPLGFLELDSF